MATMGQDKLVLQQIQHKNEPIPNIFERSLRGLGKCFSITTIAHRFFPLVSNISKKLRFLFLPATTTLKSCGRDETVLLEPTAWWVSFLDFEGWTFRHANKWAIN